MARHCWVVRRPAGACTGPARTGCSPPQRTPADREVAKRGAYRFGRGGLSCYPRVTLALPLRRRLSHLPVVGAPPLTQPFSESVRVGRTRDAVVGRQGCRYAAMASGGAPSTSSRMIGHTRSSYSPGGGPSSGRRKPGSGPTRPGTCSQVRAADDKARRILRPSVGQVPAGVVVGNV